VIVAADLNSAADGISRDIDELLAAGSFGAIVLTVIFGLPVGSLLAMLAQRWLVVVPFAISLGLGFLWGRVLRHGLVRAAERPRDARAVRPDHARRLVRVRAGRRAALADKSFLASAPRGPAAGLPPFSAYPGNARVSVTGQNRLRVNSGRDAVSLTGGTSRLPGPLHGSASRTQRYALGLTWAKIRKLGSPSGSSWNSGLTHPRSSSRPS
jgi:hypothetical protein